MQIKVKAERAGGHVHLGIWMGPHEGALGKAGTLCFRVDEWQRIKDALTLFFPDPPERRGDQNVFKTLALVDGLEITIEEKHDEQ